MAVAIAVLLFAAAVSRGADGAAAAVMQAPGPEQPPTAPVLGDSSHDRRDDASAGEVRGDSPQTLADQPRAAAALDDEAGVGGSSDSRTAEARDANALVESFDDPAVLGSAFTGLDGDDLGCWLVAGGQLHAGDATPSVQMLRWDTPGPLSNATITAKLAPGSGPVGLGFAAEDRTTAADVSLASMSATLHDLGAGTGTELATGKPLTPTKPGGAYATVVSADGPVWLRVSRQGDQLVGEAFTEDPATGATPASTVTAPLTGEARVLAARQPVTPVLAWGGATVAIDDLVLTQ